MPVKNKTRYEEIEGKKYFDEKNEWGYEFGAGNTKTPVEAIIQCWLSHYKDQKDPELEDKWGVSCDIEYGYWWDDLKGRLDSIGGDISETLIPIFYGSIPSGRFNSEEEAMEYINYAKELIQEKIDEIGMLVPPEELINRMDTRLTYARDFRDDYMKDSLVISKDHLTLKKDIPMAENWKKYRDIKKKIDEKKQSK